VIARVIDVRRDVAEWIGAGQQVVGIRVVGKATRIAATVCFAGLVVANERGSGAVIERIDLADDVAALVIAVDRRIAQAISDGIRSGAEIVGDFGTVAVGVDDGDQSTGVVIFVAGRSQSARIGDGDQAMAAVVGDSRGAAGLVGD
jgi:hypothetical protein